jgi:hypothetical protein
MELKYQSGETIKVGDRVRFDGQAGIVEQVVTELNGDEDNDWHFTEFGPGALIREVEPKLFGSVYLTDTAEEEDLELIERGVET